MRAGTRTARSKVSSLALRKQKHVYYQSERRVDAELERDFNELQMTKFGRLVDLETLQMMTGSRKLEELKQEKLHLESIQAKDVQEWEASSPETEPSLCHLGTETAKTSSANVCSRKVAGSVLNVWFVFLQGRQQFQDHRRRMDQDAIWQYQELIVRQTQQVDAMWSDINLLSTSGGNVLPNNCLLLPPTTLLPTPIADQTEINKNIPAEGAGLL
uniref:Uncharacterized protein n=1 Tax=Xiphophorus couchianus TaxID=32473 RepID=A0A3B5LDC0_9TELE